MTTNLYNKIYGAVKENVPQFKNPEDALSFYLEGASKYLSKAELAAKEDRFEERSTFSDKALMIFTGILNHLEQSPPEEKEAVKSLMEYCQMMNYSIIRMNIKNDIELASNLKREVKKMAEHWKERSEQALCGPPSDIEQNLTAETYAQNVTMANPTAANASPTLQGPKTADFSA